MPSVTIQIGKRLEIVLSMFFLIAQIHGDPSPVMSFPDSGVYSLFPHEDLRTGKSIRPVPDAGTSRARADFLSSSNSDYSRRRPGGRIIFDDDRLNFRGHFDSRERHVPASPERVVYLSREEPRRFPPIPIDGGIAPVPAFSHSRLPPGAAPVADEPTKIHVFTPQQQRPGFELPRPDPLDAYEEVRPGRLFIPGLNRGSPFLDLRDPGTDNFINHDDFLDYHKKAAFSVLQSLGTSRERRPSESSEAKRLLFTSQIHGLIPPSSPFSPSPQEIVPISSSSPEGNSKSTESTESGINKSGETENKIPISSLLDSLPRVEAINKPVLESGFIPIRNYIGHGQQQKHQRPRIPKAEAELLSRPPPTSPKTILEGDGVLETSTEVAILTTTSTTPISNIDSTTTEKTIDSTGQNTVTSKRRHSYPYVKKSSGQVTRVIQSPWPTGTSTFLGGADFDESETITFPPSAFDDFVGRRSSGEFAATKIRTEVPLIFLDSQQDLDVSSGQRSDKNAIFINRLKNPKNPSRVSQTTRTKSGVESSMTIVRNTETSVEFSESSSDEVKQTRSMSRTGIVARVHAHVSQCPKLHSAAEILCDVHIRKRHGSQNPQLTVGWKRKFHNATKEDILLAINTTLAYIEEDFHDKFNVTLAAGISPMLRSVLSIAHVQPDDTGNYECQVDDGINKLRSDTLLFLCH